MESPGKNIVLSKLTIAQKVIAHRLEIDHLGLDRTEEANRRAGEYISMGAKNYTNFKLNPGMPNYVSVDDVRLKTFTKESRPGMVFFKLYDLAASAEKDKEGKP